MRWLILLVFCCILMGCSYEAEPFIGSPEADERVQMGLHGAVREILERYWEPVDSSITVASLLQRNPKQELKSTLDATGRLVDYKKWARGRLVEHETLQLNAHGQLVESEISGYNGKRISHRSVAYFPNGKVREIQFFNANGKLLSRRWNTYDAEDRLASTELDSYEEDNGVKISPQRSIFGYKGDSDLLTVQTDFVADRRTALNHFENGQLVNVLHWNEDTTRVYFTTHYTYDAGGRVSQIEDFWEESGRRNIEKYFYDHKGRLAGKQYRSMEENHFYYTAHSSQYDSLGTLLLRVDSTGTANSPDQPFTWSARHVQSYRYQYDSLGNWTLKETWVNGELSSVRTRKLKFHK